MIEEVAPPDPAGPMWLERSAALPGGGEWDDRVLPIAHSDTPSPALPRLPTRMELDSDGGAAALSQEEEASLCSRRSFLRGRGAPPAVCLAAATPRCRSRLPGRAA